MYLRGKTIYQNKNEWGLLTQKDVLYHFLLRSGEFYLDVVDNLEHKI